ncbi:MAG: S-layer homology domain-containing protein, partial [Acidobacteria bacterium]|nr:S-layer homology domain-containing protein [Acidobacteriota bacterium]
MSAAIALGAALALWPVQVKGQFTDVPLSDPRIYWNADLMRLTGLTRGCVATPLQFCPEATITRAQMSAFVVRAVYWALTGDGDGFSTSSVPYFSDVPSTHILFRYIQKMKELGITSGCGYDANGALKYCEDRPITWGEMTVFSVRGWEIVSNGLVTGEFPFPATPYYADSSGSDAYPAEWHKYIQKGRELGMFRTDGSAGCPGNASVFCWATQLMGRPGISV